jgi:hypothetical protein
VKQFIVKRVVSVAVAMTLVIAACFGVLLTGGRDASYASINGVFTYEIIDGYYGYGAYITDCSGTSAIVPGELDGKPVVSISISGVGLKTLDISACHDLVYLNCSDNDLSSLDLSQNGKINYLKCSYNKLTELDVSRKWEIENLICEVNKLTNLDVSDNQKLIALHCAGNKLTELDLSRNWKLQYLHCSLNSLTKLDVSKSEKLGFLYCDDNNLTALDVRANKALEILQCFRNNLTALDVSKNNRLWILMCDDNKLTKLDVSNNKELMNLSCTSNKLAELDVSKNLELQDLNCGTNDLTMLDVSKNLKISFLVCSTNRLAKLNIGKNTVLEYLSCASNKLTTLDASKSTALKTLFAGENLLTDLDVSKNTALQYFSCGYNRIINPALLSYLVKRFGEQYVRPQDFTSDLKIGAIPDIQYTGMFILPNPAVMLVGKRLKVDKDYTLNPGSPNLEIGKGRVRITGTGLYEGTKSVDFKIIPKKPTKVSLKAGKRQVKVTFKTVSRVQGVTKYTVQYRMKGVKSWKSKTLTVKSRANTGSLTLKKLKKGKSYQVRVSAVKTVSRVKYMSVWTVAKTSRKVK